MGRAGIQRKACCFLMMLLPLIVICAPLSAQERNAQRSSAASRSAEGIAQSGLAKEMISALPPPQRK
jgi:hypothetical protein